MSRQGVKGLLVAVVVLLLLNLAAQVGMSSGREQTPVRGRVVGIATAKQGDTIFLFRTFEDGQTEATCFQPEVNETNRGGPLLLQPASQWLPLRMKGAESTTR